MIFLLLCGETHIKQNKKTSFFVVVVVFALCGVRYLINPLMFAIRSFKKEKKKKRIRRGFYDSSME